MQSLVHSLKSLYDQDFNLWLFQTVDKLRNRQLETLDYDHLIEELEDMGRREKSALKSNLRVVLLHLLKYRYQPQKRSGSWKASIREHRIRIHESLEISPSLKRFYTEIFEDVYSDARKLAGDETGVVLETFPEISPFTLEQTLDFDYLPE